MSQSLFPTLIVDRFIPALWNVDITEANFLRFPVGQGLQTLPDLRVNNDEIHLGTNSGITQGDNAIAIGALAGNSNQGDTSIAIGYNAANSSQAANCIQINSTGTTIAQATASTCIISPIRSAVPAATQNSLPLLYNTTTGEVFTNNQQSIDVVMSVALTTLTSSAYNRFLFISLNSNSLNRLNIPTPVVTFPASITIFNGAVIPTAFDLGTAAGSQIRVGGTTSSTISIAANTSITLHTNGTVWVRTATG